MIPEIRLRAVNQAPVRASRDYVLYWMTAFRRTSFNFALDHAIDRSRELGKPLLVLEALSLDYPWASERHHAFVLDGMTDNQRRFEGKPVRYLPFVERSRNEGRGLVRALAKRACVVVADDFPAFFLPRMLEAAAGRLDVRVEAVDANGLLPLRAAAREHVTARGFRRELHDLLPALFADTPRVDPLSRLDLPQARTLPSGVGKRWPIGIPDLCDVRISRDVPRSGQTGGHEPARRRLSAFLDRGLRTYGEGRNQPDDEDGSSGLSPWIHFGHIGVHEIFRAICRAESWSPARVDPAAHGTRQGFWGMSQGAESFLDQVITWRELGFNRCAFTDDYDRYESLPDWARKTLEAHAPDPREHVYDENQLGAARTHDEIWNAAQRQLVRDGTMHNYLRMLWGKKVLEWSPSPRDALATLIDLNNRYALDGRDPNSYSGIFWVFGRYDRPWGPERPVFGTVRYMSSQSTRRKLRLDRYLARYGPAGRTD